MMCACNHCQLEVDAGHVPQLSADYSSFSSNRRQPGGGAAGRVQEPARLAVVMSGGRPAGRWCQKVLIGGGIIGQLALPCATAIGLVTQDGMWAAAVSDLVVCQRTLERRL